MTETIHIYHTNDVHSHFHNWYGIQRYLIKQKESHLEKGESCYIVDLGDFVDRIHPLTEATHGQANVELLNAAGYDIVTIGNNEGITLPKAHLEELYQKATFDVVLANLTHDSGKPLDWAMPYREVQTQEGQRIILFGVTAPYEQFYSQLGYRVLDPYEQVSIIVERFKEEDVLLFCLSHVGEPFDRQIAKDFPEITLLFGAHTHHHFPKGERVNQTLLVATGKFGDYIGHVTLTKEQGQWSIQARTIPTVTLAEEKENEVFSRQLRIEGQQALQEVLFVNDRTRPNDLFKNTSLDRLFGRAMIDRTGADCAIFNSGIFLGDLKKGPVTRKDLHEILPHPINLATLTIDGHTLRSIYQKTQHADWAHIEVKGLGFRGTVMGKMNFERLFEKSEERLFIGNRLLEDEATYRIVTLDMFTFGFFLPEFDVFPKQYDLPALIRDVLALYGQKTMTLQQE